MNESLLDWLLEDYILGPTGLGNENISGFFLDDYWCYEDAGDGPSCRLVGPAETETHVLEDLGMAAAEVKPMAMAWRANKDAISRAIHAHNGSNVCG